MMETLSATTIFWLLAQGALVGWMVSHFIKHEGVTLKANIIWGMAGAISTGLCGLYLNLSGVLMFAFLGTLAILFLANVFHLHHVEDITGDIDRGIRIKKR